ncbi:MAG TPA: adenylosuccinate lyase [Desulfobacteraceae bacterium]|nr:adenylosuccinate lyase [Desulfobacteraceae bacterium]HPQ28573.1 adenylosuccinate lyase [Desulfobacteraceae bacterium]
MITRYTRPQMGQIWEDNNKYAKWLQVEISACEAMAQEGLIPKEAVKNIKEKAAFSVERILAIEEETKHDVIAFLTNVAEYVGPDSRYIHLGLTSSDILDTSFALLLKEAMELIIQGVKDVAQIIKTKAIEYKDTVMIGRSHGIHAEPITFGLKLAVWYSEMERNLKRLEDAKEVISHGKLSGAVGTFANISPNVETLTCKKLGIKPAPISTQIIQRDRHAQFFTSLAILAGTLEKISIEIRHLQRTEVLEVEEPFAKGQKGSSAMPHKKNPVGSENISGLSRLVRSNCMAAMENIALWHERDISHSSVERIIGPDSTILIDYMLHRLTKILKDLVVHQDRMIENLEKTNGLIFSQQLLIKLAEKGIDRQKAYVMVQRNAMKVWENGTDLKDLVMQDSEITEYLAEKEIEEVFDLDYHLKYVDHIFDRVFS